MVIGCESMPHSYVKKEQKLKNLVGIDPITCQGRDKGTNQRFT